MKTLPFTLISLTLICLSFYGHTTQCSFDIPSNEGLTLQGNKAMLKTLSCKMDSKMKEGHYLLNLASEDNASMVNDFLVSEGSIVSLIISPFKTNNVNFVLGINARLNITNDSADTVHLDCTQIS